PVRFEVAAHTFSCPLLASPERMLVSIRIHSSRSKPTGCSNDGPKYPTDRSRTEKTGIRSRQTALGPVWRLPLRYVHARIRRLVVESGYYPDPACRTDHRCERITHQIWLRNPLALALGVRLRRRHRPSPRRRVGIQWMDVEKIDRHGRGHTRACRPRIRPSTRLPASAVPVRGGTPRIRLAVFCCSYTDDWADLVVAHLEPEGLHRCVQARRSRSARTRVGVYRYNGSRQTAGRRRTPASGLYRYRAC